MPRPRTTRTDDDDLGPEIDDREAPREKRRDDFENEMFADEISNPFHIPREDWPDGLALRWISIEVTGAPDSRNWSVKTTAGWTPVVRGKYPKIDKRYPYIPLPGTMVPTNESIIFGGLCLCERDIRLTLRDKKAQEKATQDAGRTIESYVEGGNAAVPRFNQSGPVQFERGRAPAFKE